MKDNIPISYRKGFTIFYNRKFIINQDVYIPNKETEKLVDVVLNSLDDSSFVLDVGTGSGSIAVTLKKEIPNIKVYASDISSKALEVVRLNARIHDVNIIFFKSNYVDNKLIQEPTHIVADLPWGNKDSVLGTNELEQFKYYPEGTYFHPGGKTKAYEELFESILRRGWKSNVFIESGLITKDEIRRIVPKGKKWEYVPFKDYSVTNIQF